MQRTVHGTKITFATIENINGEMRVATADYMSTEKDTEKAIKNFRKVNKHSAIMSTEPFTKLYVLDDEIFFKYATVVEDEKVVENTEE